MKEPGKGQRQVTIAVRCCGSCGLPDVGEGTLKGVRDVMDLRASREEAGSVIKPATVCFLVGVSPIPSPPHTAAPLPRLSTILGQPRSPPICALFSKRMLTSNSYCLVKISFSSNILIIRQ